MVKVPANQDFQWPILSRLLDDDPEASTDPPQSYGYKLRELHQSVTQDLEDLLNTRCRCEGWPEQCSHLEHSLVNYGLPDFTSMDLAVKDKREGFARILEETIKRWEPRFNRVKVVVNDDDELDRSLSFRIEALLQVEPVPEPIVFDSTVEPVTCNFTIRRRGNG